MDWQSAVADLGVRFRHRGRVRNTAGPRPRAGAGSGLGGFAVFGGLLGLGRADVLAAAARFDEHGDLVLLRHQDRSRWDHAAIAEGERLIERAAAHRRPGPYQLQAAIAALHATAPSWEETDWLQIVLLYDQLLAVAPTPIVALNRAVAVAEMDGPAVGLAALADVDLDDYHLFHAVRADLLVRLDRRDEAASAYDRAIELAENATERAFLESRRAALD